jgi:hypothetical protein
MSAYTPVNPSAVSVSLLHESVNENARTSLFEVVASKTADFTVWADDSSGSPKSVYLVDASGGAVTVTLPAAASTDAAAGRPVTVKNSGASNNVTLDGDASETIDGATTLALTPGDCARIVSDGTAWHVIATA